MIAFGDVVQAVVWRAFKATYGIGGIYDVSIAAGNSEAYSRRLPGLMAAYWDRTNLSQQRGGFKYFPEMLRRLVFKPDDGSTPISGDFSGMDDEAIVGGANCLSIILEDSPDFNAILPSPRTSVSIDITDLYDGFNYLLGFPDGATIAKFLYLAGDTWLIYVGTSDTVFNPRCEPVDYDDPNQDS